jgi:polyhydroxyalkanoate synthase
MNPGQVDPQALAALNATFQQRYAALWSAAQSLALPAPGALAALPTLPSVVEPPPGDRRFAAAEWRELPYFSLVKQAYLLASEYAQALAALAPLPPADKARAEFATKQIAAALAPTNFTATNPEAIRRAIDTEGTSVATGFANLAADVAKGHISMTDERAFAVGGNLAVTPGDVVFRNELIELIQYHPTTAKVHARPLVIVPPCINKFYILDLKPDNSFVRWAVEQGHTVFIVSWRNIGPEQGGTTWDDYIEHGVLTALATARAIAGSDRVNALGYCVGGTLLASALAVLAARGDDSVASMTLFATLLDFADPGEIAVYISREWHALREPLLYAGQRVHGTEIAAAFSTLRPNDLIWNYVVGNYLKGETPPAFDLLYWNSDSSNLAGPMYAYYVRNMYIDNRLREPGALTMAGAPVDLSALRMPAFVLATRDDHIVPWRSAYRTTTLVGGDTVFVLAASGHIAGVISPPTKSGRNFWRNDAAPPADPDTWIAGATSHPGSWWPMWGEWIAAHGGKRKAAPAARGSAAHPPLAPAPGRYVLQTAD